jgi:hypothetical protein
MRSHKYSSPPFFLHSHVTKLTKIVCNSVFLAIQDFAYKQVRKQSARYSRSMNNVQGSEYDHRLPNYSYYSNLRAFDTSVISRSVSRKINMACLSQRSLTSWIDYLGISEALLKLSDK